MTWGKADLYSLLVLILDTMSVLGVHWSDLERVSVLQRRCLSMTIKSLLQGTFGIIIDLTYVSCGPLVPWMDFLHEWHIYATCLHIFLGGKSIIES